ncbi:uncharacterized protein TNCT_714651 [Trichonephila clavata]|uniref:Uncharacterized protein n=1 Tax=Trichonephila clavata TaxID=2740835 RepID=A0A8X6LQT7_TRICU|nr:uncharacterized protein TNCT_714651 [Trichonephila clavata]
MNQSVSFWILGPLIGYFGTKFQVQSIIICGTVLASIAVGSCYFAENIYLVITLWGVVYGTFLILFGLTSTSIPAALLLNPKYHQKRTTINQKSPALLQGCKIFSEAFQVLSASHGVSNEVINPDESSLSVETNKQSVAKDLHNRINVSNTLQNGGSLSAYQETFKQSMEIYLKANRIKSKSLESIPTFVSAKTKHSLKTKVPAHTIKDIQIDTERKSHTSEQSSKNKFRIGQGILNDFNTEIKAKLFSNSIKTEEPTISHSYSSYYQKKCKHWVFLRTEASDAHLIKEQNCLKQYGSLSREITEDSTSETKYSKPLIEPCKQTPSFRFEDKIQKNTPTPNIPSSPRNASFLEPFRVFLDVAFLFILVTQSLILYSSSMFLTIIVDFCRDCGLSSSQRVTVLVCTSVADTGGRVLLGWFTDLNYISNASFSAVCCFFMGIALLSLVFVKELILVCLSVAMLGLSLGGFWIVCPGVISDHLQEDKRSMALATRFFLYALLSLTQSPLIGVMCSN